MSDALFQNCYYIGNNFNCILYGVELVLYAMTMRRLLSFKSRSRADVFFMVFSTTNLVLITIFVAVQSVFGEEMWIVNADFPGGQGAYLQEYAAVWYQTMGTTTTVAMNLFSDGLLISRCFIVWNDFRVIIVPGFLYIATLALGIVELWASGAPHNDFFSGLAAHLGVTYYATSIGLNVLVTSLILGRILAFAHKSKRHFGDDGSSMYFSVASMIIESALPYSVAGIAFVVSYGMNSQVSILFLSFYVMFTCVSPQMLVLRVAEGRAWKRNQMTEAMTTTIAFSSRVQGSGNDSSQYTSATRSGGNIHLELQPTRKTGSVSADDVTKVISSADSNL
ncbi:hypothetical protein BV25DRAFT_1909470 [Artomyces pyxidatus]|uniref:Uncharacterized protein n=1 Tax=Artomyces pyxidatus TaxID=48021 RepID=A0ACB8SN14_9AGAM|nr:hypothetical protein BV25DRAFT_1909470 [Artomyces pyxidatus]